MKNMRIDEKLSHEILNELYCDLVLFFSLTSNIKYIIIGRGLSISAFGSASG